MRLPPLNALRAFEAAARHESFLAAAEELNVTPAAISHQIKGLEAELGLPLFHRRARGVETTPAARELLPELTRGFAHLARGVGALKGDDLAGKLVVACAPSMAALWLAPRLGGFLDRFPEIQVQLRATSRPPDLTKGEADLRIPYGAGNYPGLVTTLLMQDAVSPVAAPALLNRVPLRSFADLRNHRLLQDVEVDRAEPTMTWRRWLRDAGLPEDQHAGVVEFNDSVMLTQAAVSGQGIALGRHCLVESHLAAGRLTTPLDITRPGDYAYYTVTTEDGAQRPRVRAFLTWLRREAGQNV